MVEDLFSEAVRETRRAESAGRSWGSVSAPDAVSFRFGFPYPESFPNDDLVAAARDLFAAEGDTALQYIGGDRADALPAHIADVEERRGVACDGEDVVVTTGSTHAIDLVCRVFLDPGDSVFVEAPSFMGALDTFRTHGAALDDVPVDDRGLDTAALEADLAARRAAGDPLPTLVYTIPTFHNPSGTTLPTERRHHLLELAGEYEFVVLEDDAYGLLRYEGESVSPLRALDDTGRVVRASTFSKTIAPGVRTGWLVADGVVRDEIARLNSAEPNRFTRGVLAEYIDSGRFAENLAAFRTEYARRRDRMLAELDARMPAGTSWSTPEGGFFVWVTLPEEIDSTRMLPDAVEEGVVYLPGEYFYIGDRETASLRLAFSNASPAEIADGVAALASATRQALE